VTNTFGKLRREDLEISAFSVTPEVPVLLTGDPYVYALTIKNLRNEVRNGAIAVSWRIDGDTFRPQIIRIKDLAPNASVNAGVFTFSPTRAGFAELRVHLYTGGKGIESNLNWSPEQLANMVMKSDQFTLVSSRVRDKKEYEAEQAERAAQRRRDRWLIIVGTIAAIASSATVVIILLHL
jgi:hypothetical protein